MLEAWEKAEWSAQEARIQALQEEQLQAFQAEMLAQDRKVILSTDPQLLFIIKLKRNIRILPCDAFMPVYRDNLLGLAH